MNKYLLTFILSTAVLTQAALATPEAAPGIQHPANRPEISKMARPPKMKKHKNELNERLKLTEEQKQKAGELRAASQEKMKPLMTELIQKQQQRNQLENSDGNDKEIQTLNNEIRNIRQELHNIIIQNERDFMQILTPEQLDEFNKMREERKQIIHQKRMLQKGQPHINNTQIQINNSQK